MAEKSKITGQDERSLREMREEIRRNRSELSGTVEAIAEKFSSGHFKGLVRDELRSFERAGSWGSSFLNAVKRYPVPSAVAGAGLIFLYAKSAGEKEHGYGFYEGGEYREKISGVKEGVREKAGEYREGVREKAGELREKAGEKAGEYARYAREKQEELREAARRKSIEARGWLKDMIENNPLALAAAAFAIGAALGLGLPGSQKEREVFGEAGEALRQKAREVAGRAREEAKEEVEKAA